MFSRVVRQRGSLRLQQQSVIRSFSGKSDGDNKPTPEEIAAKDEANKKIADFVRLQNERTVLPAFARDVVPEKVEIENLEECAKLSGVDKYNKGRRVLIMRPMKNAMQSGVSNTRRWEISFPNSACWTNPLMGWTSTKDPLGNMVMKFETEEDAVFFAKKNGWKYDVLYDNPLDKQLGEKQYSYNFLPENVSKRLQKEGTKVKSHFKHPTGRASHFVKTLKYHGDGKVAQHGGDADEFK